MGEFFVGIFLFVVLLKVTKAILEELIKIIGKVAVSTLSTALVVGGILLALGLLAGEASAAVAIAVPASMAVAKMRLSTV